MYILVPLPGTKTDNRFIIVMTERYLKLIMVSPIKNKTGIDIARIFVEDWIMQYSLPKRWLTNTSSQFIVKFVNNMWVESCIWPIKTTGYRMQTNWQTQRGNKTQIISLQRRYMSVHHTDRDTFIQVLTYAYNAQSHAATQKTHLVSYWRKTSRKPLKYLSYPPYCLFNKTV